MLLSGILDALNLLIWAQTKDGAKNRNRPKSIAQTWIEKENQVQGFASGKDFEELRKGILLQIKGGE